MSVTREPTIPDPGVPERADSKPGLLLAPTGHHAPHWCDVPISFPTPCIRLTESPEARITNARDEGAIWLCECGQYWFCEGPATESYAWWWPISARRARRQIRKRNRRR